MALEDNENVDNSPESNGNGDEQSNRTFRLLMLGMGGLFVLGLVVIAVIFLTQQGGRAQIAAQNAAIQATNTAVAQLAAITPVPPTATPRPTEAATATLPPTAVPTKPAPTVAPTTAPTTAAPSTGSTGTTPEPTKASGSAAQPTSQAGSTTGTKPAATATGSAVKPASTASGSGTGASGSITSTGSTTGTVAGGETQVPKTGAGDSLGLLAMAAGLVAVFFVARRLRTTQA
jgi:outer membrane biosynthesis protein TonB